MKKFYLLLNLLILPCICLANNQAYEEKLALISQKHPLLVSDFKKAWSEMQSHKNLYFKGLNNIVTEYQSGEISEDEAKNRHHNIIFFAKSSIKKTRNDWNLSIENYKKKTEPQRIAAAMKSANEKIGHEVYTSEYGFVIKNNHSLGIKADGFKVISDYFYQNIDGLYYNPRSIKERPRRLEGIDLKNYEIFDRYLVKDDVSVYHEDYKIEGADPATFTVLEKSGDSPGLADRGVIRLAKDKNFVFGKFNGRLRAIPNLDPNNFEDFGQYKISNQLRDNDSVHISTIEVPQADPKSFEIVTGLLFKDKDRVYYWQKDKESFEIINFLDAKTLESYPMNFFIKDKDAVYKAVTNSFGLIDSDVITFEDSYEIISDCKPENFRLIDDTVNRYQCAP